jgi:hypothetical protein
MRFSAGQFPRPGLSFDFPEQIRPNTQTHPERVVNPFPNNVSTRHAISSSLQGDGSRNKHVCAGVQHYRNTIPNMSSDRIRACLATLILAPFVASACASRTALPALKGTASTPAYPNTDDGLRTLIGDLLDAHATAIGVERRMRSLIIPNSSAWFINEFGPTTGPILDLQYRGQLAAQFSRMYIHLPHYAAAQNRFIAIEHSEPKQLSPFVDDSPLIPLATQPLRLYSAGVSYVDDGLSMKVGTFVYINSNFRYLGWLKANPSSETLRSYDEHLNTRPALAIGFDLAVGFSEN